MTQADVAKAAGVSRMAVSYALRRSPMVAPETGRRIRAVAESMGYRPNPMVTSLMAQVRSGRVAGSGATLGFVTTRFGREPEAWPAALRELRKGAAERAGKAGFGLEDFRLGGGGLSPVRLSEVLAARGVGGILLVCGASGLSLLSGMRWERLAVATYGYTVKEPDLHRVVSFHSDLMLSAGRELDRRGFRRIGFVLPRSVDEPYHVFLSAHHALKLTLGARRVPAPIVWEKRSLTPVLAWIEAKRPDAILCAEDTSARRLAGRRLPGRARVVSLNRPPGAPYAGMDQRNEAIGAAMVDLVAGQIQRNEYGLPDDPRAIQIKGRWVEPDGT